MMTFAPFSFDNPLASKSSDLPNVLALPIAVARDLPNTALPAKAKLLLDIDFGMMSQRVAPSAANWLAVECALGDRRFYAETTSAPFQPKYTGWPSNTNSRLPFVCYFEALRPMRAAVSPNLVNSFLNRVQTETHASPESMIVALLYIQKLAGTIEGFYVYSRNISRLLTVAIAAASRLYDDSKCSESKWVDLHGLDACDLEVHRQFFSLQQKQFDEMIQGCYEVSSDAFVEMLQRLDIQIRTNDTVAFSVMNLEAADSVPAFSFPDMGMSLSPKMSPMSSPKLDLSMPDFAFNKSSPLFLSLSPKGPLAEAFSLSHSMPADSFTFVLDDEAPVDMNIDGDNGGILDFVAEVPATAIALPPPLPSSRVATFQAPTASEPTGFEAQDPALLVAQALLEESDDDDDDESLSWADCSGLLPEQPKAISSAPPPRPYPIPQFTSISSVDDFRKLQPFKVVRPPSSAFDCARPEYAPFAPLPLPLLSSVTRHTWQFARQIAAAQHAQNSHLERLPKTDDGFFPNL